jgi:hypothetical protein
MPTSSHPCVYRKSDPAILMMKASQDRLGSDDADALNHARSTCQKRRLMVNLTLDGLDASHGRPFGFLNGQSPTRRRRFGFRRQQPCKQRQHAIKKPRQLLVRLG